MSDFKVGDWVVVKDSKTVFKVADVFKDGYTWYAPSIKLEPRNMWDSGVYGIPESQSHLELWYPKEGEWCWFWNKDSEMPPVLRRFKQTQKDGAHITKDDCYFYDYCEPFIGELPSFIKDK